MLQAMATEARLAVTAPPADLHAPRNPPGFSRLPLRTAEKAIATEPVPGPSPPLCLGGGPTQGRLPSEGLCGRTAPRSSGWCLFQRSIGL
jgi:hypothetical protein